MGDLYSMSVNILEVNEIYLCIFQSVYDLGKADLINSIEEEIEKHVLQAKQYLVFFLFHLPTSLNSSHTGFLLLFLWIPKQTDPSLQPPGSPQLRNWVSLWQLLILFTLLKQMKKGYLSDLLNVSLK